MTNTTTNNKNPRDSLIRLRSEEELKAPNVSQAFFEFLNKGKLEISPTETTTFKFTIRDDPSKLPVGGYCGIINLHGIPQDRLEIVDCTDDVLQCMLSYLKAPRNSIFVSPKSLYSKDSWNTRADLNMLAKLISKLIFYGEVNPARCYMVGFGRGGSGVARMAPALAFLLAGAVIIHPKDHEILFSAYNLPILIVALDAKEAKKQCSVVEHYRIQVSQAKSSFPSFPIFPFEIIENTFFPGDASQNPATPNRSMRRVDMGNIFAKLLNYKRNFLPQSILWKITKLFSRDFYWLCLPEDENPSDAWIFAFHSGPNEFTINAYGVNRFCLLLNSCMIKFDKKIKVYCNKKLVFDDKVEEDSKIQEEYLRKYNDRCYKFSARQLINVPSN